MTDPATFINPNIILGALLVSIWKHLVYSVTEQNTVLGLVVGFKMCNIWNVDFHAKEFDSFWEIKRWIN